MKAAPQEQTKGFSFVSRHPMGVRNVLARTNKLTSADMALEMLCSSEAAAAMDAHARASGSSSSSTWATRTSVGLGQVRLHEGWGRESDHPTWRSRDKIEAEERRMNGTRERERETKREEVVERTASVGVGNPALELLSKRFCRVSPPSLHTLLSSPCFS